MQLNRVIGVVLLFLVGAFIAHNQIEKSDASTNPFELIGNIGQFEDVLDNQGSKVNVIEFTNPYTYPIRLESSNIVVACTGVGAMKDEDEAVVRNSYQIDALFSTTRDGECEHTLIVPPKKQAYIHVINTYDGVLPQNSVKCEYNIDLHSSMI